MGYVTGDEVLFYLRCSERFSSEVTFRQRCKRKGEVDQIAGKLDIWKAHSMCSMQLSRGQGKLRPVSRPPKPW